MKAKEKAMIIFDEYYDLLYHLAPFDDEKENPIFKEASLIAVNVIIEEIPMDSLNPKWKYWNDVRDVLNAL